ncbi:hypothetical protein R6Q57_021389 [Mikania cordata]
MWKRQIFHGRWPWLSFGRRNSLTMVELFKRKVDAERRDISQLKELLSDKESNYRDARRRIYELSSELEQDNTQLSKTKIKADKYEYASTLVANMIDFQSWRKEKIGLGFTEVKPPFNHNYSSMPNINTYVDDLLLKTHRRKFECFTFKGEEGGKKC